MAGSKRSEELPAAVPAATLKSQSHVDWPAILAGAIVASAIAFVLGAFGSAIGLTLIRPYPDSGIAPTALLIGTGIWIVWVAASSFMAGGYLAGRMRRRVPDATEHEVDIRDGCHGLVVWGLGVLIGAAVLATGVQTTARVGAEAVSKATAAAAPNLAYYATSLLRTADNEDRPNAAAATNEIQNILKANVGEDGQVADEDKAYLATLVARNTKLSADDARSRVDQILAKLAAARQKARELADAARKMSIVAAFVLAASLLIGAAGAWWGASIGGRHRDEQSVFARFGRLPR